MFKRFLLSLTAGTVMLGVTAAQAEVLPATPTLYATVGDAVNFTFIADDADVEFMVMGGYGAGLDWSYFTYPAAASGVLTQAGTFTFTIYSRDMFNMTLSEREYTLVVAPAAFARPVGRDASFGVEAGVPLTISSSALIDSIDGGYEYMWFPAQPSKGTLSMSGIDVVYTPTAGATGTDSFTFVIVASKSTEYAESDPQTVTLNLSSGETPQPIGCTITGGAKFVFRHKSMLLPC
jgi:hypothetical protein